MNVLWHQIELKFQTKINTYDERKNIFFVISENGISLFTSRLL